MNGYRKILVAYDGSDSSINILEQVCRMAKVDKSWVKLLLVIPRYEGELELTGISNIRKTIDGPYEELLSKAKKVADSKEVNMLINLTQGEPYEKIVDVAEKENCDLIVMGRKGRSHIERALIGGVTARVIGHTQKDVLVVGSKEVIDWSHLLVATDDSVFSQSAVAMGFEIAQSRNSHLSMLSVVPINEEYFALAPEHHNEMVKNTEQLLSQIEENGKKYGITLTTAMKEGEPFKEICSYASRIKASMIILGSHGRKGLTRLLMGSVTEHVIGLANVPVMVRHHR